MVRIAFWSGPRNISTALLRSWGNRSDTFVADEPLYAHYLAETGFSHPGAAEVIAHHETDWRWVASWLTGPIPQGKAIFYQKQMSHHLLPGIDRGWLAELQHGFLLREPREMLTSLLHVLPEPTLPETGLPQQLEIYRWVRAHTDQEPPVVDSADILRDPRRMLTALCEAFGVPFEEAMLAWEPGPRATDGVWAPHWYGNVLRSTGFGPYRPKDEEVPERFRGLLAECEAVHAELAAHRLRP